METDSLQKINKAICCFLEDRLNRMGDRIGGLYNYYVQRLKMEEILSKEDKGIIDYIQKEISLDAKILEVGGGIGQLGHSLSLLGYHNIAICEVDKRRRDACIALGKTLLSKSVIIEQKFPDCCNDELYDLVIIANIVNQCNDLERDIYALKDILVLSDILLAPGLYDEKINYTDAISRFLSFNIQFIIIGDGLILLKGLL
jgi:2-polyprenyl-3-methyl-5-hydroxy-6-metoxy-1,4-benzoquinol methylase